MPLTLTETVSLCCFTQSFSASSGYLSRLSLSHFLQLRRLLCLQWLLAQVTDGEVQQVLSPHAPLQRQSSRLAQSRPP